MSTTPEIVIISGQIPVRPDRWDKAYAVALRHQEASRAEPGCLEFSFTRDLEHPNTLQLFERWESDAAFAAHMEGPAFTATNAALPEITAGPITIQKFRAEPLPFPFP